MAVNVQIDYDTCENSGYCLQVCPEDVFQVRGASIIVAKPENCTECWLCVQNCPTGAVTIE